MLILVTSLILLISKGAYCQNYSLVFEDNFDILDFNNWVHEVTCWGGGNGEFQVYTDDTENSYVKNGLLYIRPTLLENNINPLTGQPFGVDFLYGGTLDLIAMYEQCTQKDNNGCLREGWFGITPPVASARLRSKRRFNFQFGKVEVVAKMPVGDWLWPAIWFLPEYLVYGGWPRSGEIDLVEARGNRDLLTTDMNSIGIDHAGATLHWGPQWDDNKSWLTSGSQTNTQNNYGDFFHTYGMEWDTNGMRFTIDNSTLLQVPNPPIDQNPGWQGFWEYGRQNGGWWSTTTNPWASGTNMAPFDQHFHMILNVAVGGTNGYFPDGVIVNGGIHNKPWNNGDSDADVRFYNAVNDWFPTWEGENSAMQIDSIKVWQRTL